MIREGTWRYVKLLLARSLWMRFSLEYTRGRWCAVFFHERGHRVYGKQWGSTPDAAVFAAAEEASRNSLHLKPGKHKAVVTS